MSSEIRQVGRLAAALFLCPGSDLVSSGAAGVATNDGTDFGAVPCKNVSLSGWSVAATDLDQRPLNFNGAISHHCVLFFD